MKPRLIRLLVSLACIGMTLQLVGCGESDASSQPPNLTQKKPLIIFAAASATNVIEQLGHLYEQQTGVKVLTSFASSSTLARQIEQGAHADLFLSANDKWMNYLQDRQLIQTNTRKALLGNRVVIINTHEPNATITTWDSIEPLKHYKDKLAMGDPDHVPAGIYGKAALTHLGIWETIASQVVPAKDVRGALMLVETGQAPLGIVYATDAVVSNQVAVVYTLPSESHKPVHYPLALTKESSSEGASFAVFLQSDIAEAVFRKAGFEIIK